MFSGQNNEVSIIDEGLPGTLPIPNVSSLHMLTILSNLFKAHLSSWLSFTRKGYFYVDLPLGYQITQKFYPIITSTKIPMISLNINKHHVNWFVFIECICLEQDSGNISRDRKHVGFYRSGKCLIELTTCPCFDGIIKVKLFILKLKSILIYTRISACNMEDSGFRFDVNVSLTTPLIMATTKTEFKNINSLAILDRILPSLASDKWLGKLMIISETKSCNKANISLNRLKESEYGYKYFLDPDLTPTKLWVLNPQITLLTINNSQWLVLVGLNCSISKEIFKSTSILTKTGLILLLVTIKSMQSNQVKPLIY